MLTSTHHQFWCLRLLSTKAPRKEACTLCSADCWYSIGRVLMPAWWLGQGVPIVYIFLPEGRIELLLCLLLCLHLLHSEFFFWLAGMPSGLVPWWLHMGQICPPGLWGQASLWSVDVVCLHVAQFIHLLLYNLCLVFEMPRILLATFQRFCLYGTRHFVCIYTNISKL